MSKPAIKVTADGLGRFNQIKPLTNVLFSALFILLAIMTLLPVIFVFIISSVPAFFGYTVEGGSVNVGKASTDAVVSSSALILFSDVFLTQLLS